MTSDGAVVRPRVQTMGSTTGDEQCAYIGNGRWVRTAWSGRGDRPLISGGVRRAKCSGP